MSDKLLNTAEAAQKLGVSVSYLSRLGSDHAPDLHRAFIAGAQNARGGGQPD